MSSLSHHGIKGQRWGVRRFQNKDGTLTREGQIRFAKNNLKHAKVRNLDKWGKSPDSNVLYIIGTSGSGKSTTAKGLADDGDQVIHLDTIFEKENHGSPDSNKDFEAFLKENNVDISKASDFSIPREERWKTYDAIGDLVETYGQHCFSKGSKVVIEGVQMGDQTLYPDKNYFNGKPTVVLKGNIVRDTFRADRRDGVPLRKTVVRLTDKERWNWYKQVNSTSNEIKYTSIGGTMYIEGNALILGDSSYLEHHGILGQKWGVRRFQNKDGTRTAAGKARDQKNAAKSVVLSTRRTRNSWQYQNAFTKAQDKLTNDSKSAVRKMAIDALNGERKAEYEAAVDEYDAATNYRYDEYLKEDNKYLAIAGMASGQRYPMLDTDKFDQDTRLKWDAEFYMYNDGDQGKYNSYDYFLVAKGENPNKVFDRAMKARNNIESIAKKDADDILGDTKDRVIKGKVKDRTVSDELAYQITEMAISASDYTMVWEHGIPYSDDEIKQMKQDIDKYSKEAARLGLTHSALFIEDGTLYLSHHGIRGQRWGVRRFQNRDGSLTNAGRKRLGYATKGAVQTVGKAFKAGVKVGGNAVKAAKAHHEEAEAKKKEKKKEKASHSRLGVLANKDLFTDDELRALNQRFKVEDELKMASIQKGVEIAKAVGTIASNAATAAKAYEDITGQSLSPIKRQAAELKKQQDAEDRARKIASEDAEEARKAAQEERNIKKFDQELRKATADADKEEFLAKKTKAQADQEILKALKGARDFDKPDDDDDDPPKPPNGGGGGNPPGGGSDDGSSWVQKATAGGKNPFEKMIYDNDPEYKAAKDAHDEKVARKERMEYLDKHIAEREQEKQAEKAAKDKALMDMINQSNARTGRGQSTPPKESQPETPRQDSDALFSQKGSLPIDKDRYRNRKAAEKAKKVKEDVAEDRAKKQDEKAVDQTINDVIAAQRRNNETIRNMDPHAYDRSVAKEYVKDKAKETINKIPETLGNLNPINRAARKIANKVEQEGYENTRKAMKQQYEDMAKSQGRDEANYVMYNTRVAGLQGQGYSEKQARQIADSDPTFSSKRNRRVEYSGKVAELETARRNTSKKLDEAERELSDKYYKTINSNGDKYYNSPEREALDRDYERARANIQKLREENQQLFDKGIKDAQKILEHSFSIQNGVLFIDSSDGLAHHGVKGQRWGVSGTRMRSKKIAKYENMLKQSNMEEGMYHVENGTLFIDAGDPYLEHHGVLGMKWGKHLRAGKGPASAPASAGGGGGGAPEEDEETKKKIEEAAKKAGMTADEYRKKFADRVAEIKKAAYNAAGGSHKKDAAEYRKMSRDAFNEARKYEASGNADLAKAASAKRKGNTSAHSSYKSTGDNAKDEARKARERASALSEGARQEQARYEKSLAGRYDKMKAGGAKKTKKAVNELSTKVTAAKKRLKDVPGELYGSKHREDFERNARLHENNRKSMHAQAKAAWEGYGESRTAAQRDNWKRYAEYDRQAKASGNMFVKRERSKQAYDNSLASKVDSVKRKARLTQDKAKSKISDAVDAAKKTSDDVKSTVRSKTGIGVKKDINRNARLAEGQQKRAHELTKQVYSAKNKDDWARAYSESNKESFKALDNEYKVKKDAKSYPKSIAGRVESTKRKARLTKDRLKSTLGKSKQRKQLSTVGPKAKKQISNARDDVEKASRSNENAYKHAKAVYRQTGSDSDAYKQAIKRSGTTLQRYIDSKKLLEKKKRAKHSDDTNAIYTEGTRLVVNSKWG